MILDFENAMSGDFILDRAQSFFDKEDYVFCVKFINNYFDECSLECQTFLSTLAARCYHELGSIDMAITSLKRAVTCDGEYPDALYFLALYQNEKKERVGVQEAFFALNSIDEEGLMSQEILSLIILDTQTETDFKLVTPEEIKSSGMSEAENHLKSGAFEEALAILIATNIRLGDDVDVLNDIAIIYLYMEDIHRSTSYAKRAIALDELNPNSYFILAKATGFENNKQLLMDATDKLMAQKATDLMSAKKIASMLEMAGDYSKLLVYLDKYPEPFCYSIMMMRCITSFNLGDRDGAISQANEICKIYGNLGLALTYKRYFEDTQYDRAVVEDYNELPSGITANFALNNNTIIEVMTVDNCYELVLIAISLLPSDKLYTYLTSNNELLELIKEESFIECINVFSHIPKANKSTVIRYLIKHRDVVGFTLYHGGGAYDVDYTEVPNVSDYPSVYSEAYILAFAAACMHSRDFEEGILVSMNELMVAMSAMKHDFSDVKKLAAAILCNSYVIVSDDIRGNVSEIMGVTVPALNECIDKIKENGAFFDLDQDEIFSKHIKGVMSRFGIIDNIEE